jgi:diacylglycerol kinase family enzyme
LVDPQNTLVIFNPAAGSAQWPLARQRLRAGLKRAGLPPRWEETSPERGADRIVLENPGSGPVVVVGGDGTVMEAARALRGGTRPLCIVPLGTGNVMALRLDIPLILEAALGVLGDGVLRHVDVAFCGDEPYLLTAGMGLDGRLIRESSRRLKRQMGKLAYIWAVLRNLPVRHERFQLELDDQSVEEEGASVMVANFGTQVGPWIYPPDADGGDGRLDIAVMKAATIGEAISLLAAPFRLKAREHKGVRLYRSERVHVVARRPMPLQIDGEDRGDRREFRCSIEAATLPVLVSKHRPVFQWGREWPPNPLEWQPWGGAEDD